MSSTGPAPDRADAVSAIEDAAIEDAAIEDAKRQLRERFEEWDAKVAEMRAKSAGVDWSKADWSKLNPKDVSVEFGPAMTEEQFKEWRKNRHVKVMKR